MMQYLLLWAFLLGSTTCQLFQDLKLEVLYTDPTQLQDSKSISLDGSQSLSAVFSRPVLSLGGDFGVQSLPNDKVPFVFEADFPFVARWVQSYVYRLDPIGSYPSDLQTRIVWNKNLTTWDGVKFDIADLDVIDVSTQSINMFKQDITSQAALVATDGRWPLIGEELLPGGRMEITFSGTVQIPLMKTALALYENQGEDLVSGNEILIFSCFANESTVDLDGNPLKDDCIKVSFAKPLNRLDHTYTLEFKGGAQYDEINGVPIINLEQDRFDFPGPRSNFIDFSTGLFQQTFQRLRFQLPRGLKQGTTSLQDLKAAISLNIRQWNNTAREWFLTDEFLPFELNQLESSLFEIEAELVPDASYLISVTAKNSVKDAFNVPLLASAVNITMADVTKNQQFSQPQTSGDEYVRQVFDAYAGNPSWSIITRLQGQTDSDDFGLQSLNFYSVPLNLSTIDIVDYVIRCVSNYFPSFFHDSSDRADIICIQLDKFVAPASANITATGSDDFSIGTVDLKQAFENSGIVLKQKCCSEGEIDDFDAVVAQDVDIMQSTYIFGVVSYLEKALAPCFDRSCDTIVVWVNDLASGPAEGANVQIYDMDFKVTLEGTTDSNGLAMFSVAAGLGVYSEIRALVTYKGLRNLFSSLSTPNAFQQSTQQFIGKLVLDHTLIRPEETVLLKGYLRFQSGLDITIPQDPELVLKVSSALNGIGDIGVQNYDPQFGTFEANITAVQDLPLRNYFVELRDNKTNDFLDEVKIVAADPRAPTVFLNVDSPFFIRPNTTASVTIRVGSLIGAKLANETITVRWQAGDDEDKIQRTVLTNEEGVAVAQFDLQIDAPTLDVGDQLRVDVEYIGPTRECLTDARTISIRESALNLRVDRSLVTHIPGVEFGVVPILTSEDPNLILQNQNVLIQLQSSQGVVVQECEVMSNKVDFTLCRISLPQMGEFKIVSTVLDDQGDAIIPVVNEVSLGKTAEEWMQNPRRDYGIDLRVFTDKASYSPGETATLLVDAVFEDSSLLLVVMSALGNITQVLPMKQGMNSIEVPTDGICRKQGCITYVWMFAPRRNYTNTQIVPTSIAFDESAAYYSSVQGKEITVNNDEVLIDLGLNLTSIKSGVSSTSVSDFLVVQPLEEVKLEIQSDSLLTEAGIDTEVTVFIVDRSILDVVPTPFVDIVSPFEVSAISQGTGTFAWNEFGPSFLASALAVLMESALRRLDLDPFLDLDEMLVYDTDSTMPADQSDEDYLRQFFISLTREISPQRVPNITVDFDNLAIFTQNADIDMPQILSEELESKLEEISEGVKRKVMRFAATPVYGVLRTEEDGKAVLAFTAPVALSRFNIRAYASGAGDIARFGKQELDFIVRRPVSTTAAVPRQVRTSDEFEAGVIITISPDAGLFQIGQLVSINLSINITNPQDETAFLLDLEGSQTQVSVVVGDPVEVRFPMRADVVGQVDVEFVASDPNTGSTDWTRVTIPINPLSLPITLIDSISLDATSDAQFQELFSLQPAIPGSGTINMTAGVGRIATIQSFASTILRIRQQENPQRPYALTALATTVSFNILEGLGIQTNSSTPLGDLLAALLPFYDNSLAQISNSLTTFSNGLRYYIPRFSYTFVDLFLNSWALQTVNDLRRTLGSVPFRLEQSANSWDRALKSEVEDDAEDYRSGFFFRASIFPLRRLVDFRYAVGPEWQPSNEDITDDLSINRLAREFRSLNFDGQLSFALTLVSYGNLTDQVLFNTTTGQDIVNEILSTAQSRIRFQRQKAFVAFSQSSQSPARGLTQSRVLQLFLRTNTGTETIAPALANFISSSPIRFPAFDIPCLNTLVAIFEYEKFQSNDSPNVDFTARSGNVTLLDAVFDSLEIPTANQVTSFDDLDNPPKPVEVRVVGQGEIGVSTLLIFSPTVNFPFPQFRGLLIQRVIRLLDANGDGTGRPLTKVPLSSVVNIELQILTSEDLGGVEILVPMPGGLEPIDPNVPSCSPGGNAVCYLGGFFSGQTSNRFRFGFSCPSMETRTNVVTFRYFNLYSGTSDIQFKAIAATEGTFVLPSVTGASVEDPSISGLSAGGTFVVCDDCEPEFEGDEKVPIPCPNNCSGVGVCDITSGTCTCDAGYTADDCSQIVQQ